MFDDGEPIKVSKEEFELIGAWCIEINDGGK